MVDRVTVQNFIIQNYLNDERDIVLPSQKLDLIRLNLVTLGIGYVDQVHVASLQEMKYQIIYIELLAQNLEPLRFQVDPADFFIQKTSILLAVMDLLTVPLFPKLSCHRTDGQLPSQLERL